MLVDIEIPFWRIVAILIKWFLASIPALIVLSIIFAIIGAILGAIFGEAVPPMVDVPDALTRA